MRIGFRLPSPALVVASLALLVALSGTAVAAGIVPLAKRALLSDNAAKLQGKTPAQVAALAKPAPVTSVNALTSIRSTPFSLGPRQENDIAAACESGERAISGGFDNPSGTVFPFDSRPIADGSGWRLYLFNPSDSTGASGSVYVVCLK